MVLATAITKTEEVGWDPNHLILPSQSSYLHQDNLALRSTCYVLDHIGFIRSLLLVLTMSVTSTLITLGARSYHLTECVSSLSRDIPIPGNVVLYFDLSLTFSRCQGVSRLVNIFFAALVIPLR
ncbi:hypothetical protein Pcinc_010835 [Petrolisthes cinctipes]|uniref:Uncharacterized protein n=1 Tax=Petrolisthes cinctipes TaxID=88211 RepID=A0AAE1BFT0_PETCI|nr:hypothetical protein Pcinc_043341 [Petrolisthes cinctipes]KAK3884992.1 hypothetical protein Pcinc_010835 [Petrolisthes cinctipes]